MPPCWLFVFPGNMVSFFAYRYYTMLSTLHTSLLVYLLDHGGLGGRGPPRLAASAPALAIGSLQLLGARGRHQSTGQHSHHPVGLRAHQGAPAREGGQLTYCTLLSGGMRGALYRYGFNTHTCRYRVKTK